MIKTEIKSTYMKCDNKDSITMSHTMHPAVYYDATSTSQLLARAAWITTKGYKMFPIWVKYHSTKTII
jgi:hypothetical protein